MSASYTNPLNTNKDAVRFLIQDTGPTNFHFTDEEILWALKTQANIYMAAALFCDKLTTVMSSGGLSAKSIGGLSESYSAGAVQFYSEQAKRYRLMGSGHQIPCIAEISQKFSFRQFDGQGGQPRIRSDNSPVISDEEQTK